MGDIKYELFDDGYDDHNYGKRMEAAYEEYRDIVIEVDEKILKFISSFKIGSFLSLEVLVGLADKYECHTSSCGALFYSKRLFEEHKANHGFGSDSMELTREAEEINGKELIIAGNPADFENSDIAADENDTYIPDDIDMAIDEFKEEDEDEYDEDNEPDEENERMKEEKYKCEPCDESFVKESWLVRHSLSHPEFNRMEYSCFHCDKVYGGKHAKSSYKKHVDRLINREKDRVCDMCGHVAKTPDYLETHKQVKHFGFKGFKCELDDCDKQFSLKKYLIKHMKTHNSSESYQCNMCDFKTHLQKNLQRHIMRQHVDKITLDLNCDECEYVAPNKDRLQTHKRNYHSGTLHECNECDKKYRDRGKYLLHIRRDHEGVRYQCENCDQKFTHKHTLVTHIKRKHEGLKLKCEKCDHEATSQRALRWHILKVHERNPFSCDQCPFVGSNYPFLYSHKNKIHNGVKYHCDLCEHVSYNETLLKHHMKQNHPDHEAVVYEHQKTTFRVEDYPRCEPCNKLFQTRKRYLNHNKEKHSESGGLKEVKDENSLVRKKQIKRVKCPTCDKDFTSERRVERHIIINHNTLLQCTKCDDNFTDKKLFIEHKNVHRQGSITNCEECGKEMRSKSLPKHIKMFHRDIEPEKKEYFSCTKCPKRLTSEGTLERHIYLNHSSVLQCSTCGKSFTDKKVFINHQKWHRYDTPTACDVCGKELKRSSLLKHMQMHHSDERPSKNNFCDVCGKSFYVKATLVIHMKKHNNQKDILCTYEGCNMAFYTTSHMKDHVRVHTGQAIRQCGTCLKDFKSMSAYRYHIRRIHPITGSNTGVQNSPASFTPNLNTIQ